MNTHYAMLVTSVPPSAEVIAHGPAEFCRDSLSSWLSVNELPVHTRALVVAVDTEAARRA